VPFFIDISIIPESFIGNSDENIDVEKSKKRTISVIFK
jgi:hypothetical protein